MFNRFLGVLALALMLALGANSARAQGALQVGGALTPGHLMMAYGNNFGMDAGGPTLAGGSPPNSTLPGTRPTGIAFVNSGLPVCAYSAYANLPYDSLCWGFDGQGNVLLQWGGLNGVAALPNLYFTPLGGASNFWLDTLGNPNGLTQPANDNSTKLASTAFVKGAVTSIANVRTRLTGTLTLYRSPTGVDSGGCTLASPCLTRNYVWNLLCNSYDLAGNNVVIQDTDGTYTDDFHPQCNPVGNGTYASITFQGHVGSQSSVIWSQAAGTTLEGGSASSGPSLVISSVTLKGNGSASLVTTTQWGNLTLQNVTFGCNPGQRDINPSVGSRVYYASGNIIDKSACTFTTNVTATSGVANVTVASATGIQIGQYVSDFNNLAIPPNTKVTNVSGTTITLSQAPTANMSGVSTSFETCGINHWQQDPGSVLNITATSINTVVPPCYSQGFVSNNAALTFVLNNATFTGQGNLAIGPPFSVIGGGQIYAPAAAGLNYFPGQVFHTASVNFPAFSSVLTLATFDKNWLAAYAPMLSQSQGIAVTGTGLNNGTVFTDVNNAVGNTVPIAPYTASAQNVSLTIGGQMASGGLYLTSSSLPIEPMQAMPFKGPLSWTPTDGSGASLTFTNVLATYQQVGETIEGYATLTYPTTASGANAVISGLPVPVPNADYGRQQSFVTSVANTCFLTQPNTSTASLVNCQTSAAILNSSLSTAKINFQFRYPAY